MQTTDDLVDTVHCWLRAEIYGYGDHSIPTVWLWLGYDAPTPVEKVTIKFIEATPYDEDNYSYHTWHISVSALKVSIPVHISIDGRS